MATFQKVVWSNVNNGPITPSVANRWENGIEEAIMMAENAEIGGELANRVATLESQVADLRYIAINVSSASIVPSHGLLGETVSGYSINYTFNKIPASILLKSGNTVIEEISIPVNATGQISKTGLTVTTDLNLTLIGSDERNATAQKTLKIEFMNQLCYGAANTPGAINSAFVNGLSTKVLSKSKAKSFTVNASGTQHIWFALPTRLGVPVFTVGGFEGGFTLAATITHTNSAGYSEEYRIYKSDNAGLGSTTVNVS